MGSHLAKLKTITSAGEENGVQCKLGNGRRPLLLLFPIDIGRAVLNAEGTWKDGSSGASKASHSVGFPGILSGRRSF